MGCARVLHNGMQMWICGRDVDSMEIQNSCCSDCGEYVVGFLCDYPVGKDKTCDRLLCDNCAKEIGPELHYCKHHFKAWEKFREDGGVKKELENVVPYKKERKKRWQE